MDEQLKILLEGIAPTWRGHIRGTPDTGISYTCYLEQDAQHESGGSLGTQYYYRVNLFQRILDVSKRRALVSALRAAGWAIGERAELEDDDEHYYQYSIDISRWEASA